LELFGKKNTLEFGRSFRGTKHNQNWGSKSELDSNSGNTVFLMLFAVSFFSVQADSQRHHMSTALLLRLATEIDFAVGPAHLPVVETCVAVIPQQVISTLCSSSHLQLTLW